MSLSNLSLKLFIIFFTAFIGLPSVQIYSLSNILLSLSIITALVEIDPISTPKYAFFIYSPFYISLNHKMLLI